MFYLYHYRKGLIAQGTKEELEIVKKQIGGVFITTKNKISDGEAIDIFDSM